MISSHGPTPGNGAHPFWVLGRECIADHVADVVGDEIDLVDLERIEHAGSVFALGFLVVTSGRPRRQAKTAQVRHDHGMVAGEPPGERRPHVSRFAIAVQQDYGRASAADTHIDPRAVGGDGLGLKLGRERLDRGRRG
jgi:hypothetical protein